MVRVLLLVLSLSLASTAMASDRDLTWLSFESRGEPTDPSPLRPALESRLGLAAHAPGGAVVRLVIARDGHVRGAAEGEELRTKSEAERRPSREIAGGLLNLAFPPRADRRDIHLTVRYAVDPRGPRIESMTAVLRDPSEFDHAVEQQPLAEKPVATEKHDLRLVDVKVAGALSRVDVADQLGRRRESLLACVERVGKRVPGLSGKATLQLTVATIGRVSAAKLEGSPNAELSECIERLASFWRFPSAPKETRVSLAIELVLAK